jgi:hypothetical protein
MADDGMDEREEPNRNLRISTRVNAAFKWKHDKSVVGGLEVKSVPLLDLHAKLEEKKVLLLEDEFGECLKFWKELKLRKSFIEACESMPPATHCCGLVNDQDGTIKNWVTLLNAGWCKKVNEQINDLGYLYKVSCFVWSWSNASGKAETVVMMIRFHSLNTSRR